MMTLLVLSKKTCKRKYSINSEDFIQLLNHGYLLKRQTHCTRYHGLGYLI